MLNLPLNVLLKIATSSVMVSLPSGRLCPVESDTLAVVFYRAGLRYSSIYYPNWAINIVLLMVVDNNEKL
jgi:hypothetical protein